MVMTGSRIQHGGVDVITIDKGSDSIPKIQSHSIDQGMVLIAVNVNDRI